MAAPRCDVACDGELIGSRCEPHAGAAMVQKFDASRLKRGLNTSDNVSAARYLSCPFPLHLPDRVDVQVRASGKVYLLHPQQSTRSLQLVAGNEHRCLPHTFRS